MLLFGIVSLALDAGHLYLVSRGLQNAVDAAVLAAGKTLALAAQSSAPASSSDAAVTAAHDFAGVNGFATVKNLSCDVASASQFRTSWYDVPAGVGCGGGAGWTTKVDVFVPPQVLTPNCQARPLNCVQVTITQQVRNYLFGALGIPTTTIVGKASAYAQPPGSLAGYPNPVAVYLRQPQLACPVGNQCFTETTAPSRSNMSSGNSPTFWVVNGSKPLISGLDGNLTGAGDTQALQSAGDIVVQDSNGLTICDPYNGGTCSFGATVGSKGFSVAVGSSLVCAAGGTVQAVGQTACTAPSYSPAGTTGPLWGTEVSPPATSNWQPAVTAPTVDCGYLVLNGEAVKGHSGLNTTAAPTGCDPDANNKYTIMPGKYRYIVINHGQYEFASGLYDIDSSAPAGAIDHSNEGSDFDLCSPLAGCTTTAGIWITHGSGPSSAYYNGGAGSCPSPGFDQAGGGDPTKILGTGVSFRFQSGAGGFVSSHEVTSIALIAPGFGALPAVNNIPLLFDLENSHFIHLDATPGFINANRFQGIIYQTGSATAGGVEVNPGLTGGFTPSAAVIGQILAYSLTTFGSAGASVDFRKGLSGASAPIISTAGQYEASILSDIKLVPDTNPAKQKLVVSYYDEFDLDAFDAYVKINNGSAVYFSKGLWPTAPAPPATNNPGDSNPAYPVTSGPPAGYTIVSSSPKPDWIYTYADGSTFEVNGDWAWGHQLDIIARGGGIGTGVFNQSVTLTYTFTIPVGQTLTAAIYMTDGDFCGDYVTATYTFYNIGQASPGQQVAGNVHLEQ
jgi:Flp pilus assembly protein TadG